MSSLRPGVGIEDLDPIEAVRRQRFEKVPRVAAPQADILELSIIDRRQRLCNAVDERFATNETNFGMRCSFINQPRAVSEPDFHAPFGVGARKNGFGRQGARRDFQFEDREKFSDQMILPLAKLLPLPPAVELLHRSAQK